MFIQNKASVKVGGREVLLEVKSDYPRSGRIRIGIAAAESKFKLHIRKPGFVTDWQITIGGERADFTEKNHYAVLERSWNECSIEINFEITPHLVFSNPLVRADCGKACIMRGPEVYCLEECDNGANLGAVVVENDVDFTEVWRNDVRLSCRTFALPHSPMAHGGTGEKAR